MIRCTCCGTEMKDGLKFCTQCGGKLSGMDRVQNGAYQNGGYQNTPYQNASYQNGPYPNGQYQYDPNQYGYNAYGARMVGQNPNKGMPTGLDPRGNYTAPPMPQRPKEKIKIWQIAAGILLALFWIMVFRVIFGNSDSEKSSRSTPAYTSAKEEKSSSMKAYEESKAQLDEELDSIKDEFKRGVYEGAMDALTEEVSGRSSNAGASGESTKESGVQSDSGIVPAGMVTPSFKETMDSYEAFFDKCFELMDVAANGDSEDSLLIMAEYADYMLKYADMMEKMESMDTENLSDADMAYYLEVTARIEAKAIKYMMSVSE